MLNEYEIVRLLKPLPGQQVPVGSKGTTLMAYNEPKIGYEVEFVDSEGKSLGVFTVDGDQVEWWKGVKL